MTVAVTVSTMPARADMESIRESIDIQLPIQIHTRPSTPVQRDEIYNMQVLSLDFGKTEDDLDQHFLITALNLGITIPQHPTTTLELIADNVSALTISSDPSDPYSATTRTSESTQPTSCGSSQQQLSPTTASSLTTGSIPSAPASFTSSSKASSIVKIRKGLRRLSTFTRRKTFDSVMPPVATPVSAMKALKFDHRSSTADATRASVNCLQPALATQTTMSLPDPPRARRSRPKTIVEEMETEDTRQARERSKNNPRLQRLRVRQLEEQSRFLRFEDEQSRLVRLKKDGSHQGITDRFQTQQHTLWERHATVMADLELRHLTAELDLSRALQSERKACETRLRHMDAYCHSRTAGMPRRHVTDADLRKLVQQAHLRRGMDSLHEARINVLREKQAKQSERIAAKQDAELAAAAEVMAMELRKLDSSAAGAEADLQQDFWERKGRLLARWALAEAIERRRLECEHGWAYAALPLIEWAADCGRGPEPVRKRMSLPPGPLEFHRTAMVRPLVQRGVTSA